MTGGALRCGAARKGRHPLTRRPLGAAVVGWAWRFMVLLSAQPFTWASISTSRGQFPPVVSLLAREKVDTQHLHRNPSSLSSRWVFPGGARTGLSADRFALRRRLQTMAARLLLWASGSRGSWVASTATMHMRKV